MSAQRTGVGRWLLTVSAVFTGIAPIVVDWNETHVYNPLWPPHAKFHNGQTMSMGVFLSLRFAVLIHLYAPTHSAEHPNTTQHPAEQPRLQLLSRDSTLYYTWRPQYTQDSLFTATLLATMYWLTQLTAWFVPGAAGQDPPSSPMYFPQLYAIVPLTGLSLTGYYLESRRLRALKCE
ncbi:hypothetical protein LTR28_012123 [Elasticomyces elasticus]|nr:hypothetical protein LTR28_012123 [Elasticomyces elasticus]